MRSSLEELELKTGLGLGVICGVIHGEFALLRVSGNPLLNHPTTPAMQMEKFTKLIGLLHKKIQWQNQWYSQLIHNIPSWIFMSRQDGMRGCVAGRGRGRRYR